MALNLKRKKLASHTSPAKRASGRPHSYPALVITQNKHRFYFCTIPVDDLFPYCFVARREEDPVSGFQRVLNESRADDISKYLANGSGSIPSNIVLSAQSSSQLKYKARTKSISFKRQLNSFLVLDGQHRLWGYDKCRKRHRVPVAVYENLSRSEETKLFIDINTNQRGVPAALLLDIKHMAEIESTQEQILREIFNKLMKDPASPLAGKLSPARSIAGKVSRVTFNKALRPRLTSGTLVDTDPENRYKLILNYLNAFDAESSGSKLLIRAAFFEAIFEVFEEVIRTTMNQNNNVKQSSIQEIIRPLMKFDYKAGGMTKKAIVDSIHAALRKNIHLSTELL